MVQLTSAILLLSAATSAFATQCFYPAGNPASENVPCDDNAEVSPCCASKDKCLSNGLCRVNSDTETTEFARGSCTDENWGPGCFPQCLISHPGSPITNGAAVFMCNSTGWTDPKGASYCCEQEIDQKTGCCDGSTFWLPPGGVALPVSSASIASSASSSSASSTSTSEATPIETFTKPSVTTVESYTTTTASCTTSTSLVVTASAQQNTTSTTNLVISTTSSAPVTSDVVTSATVVVPTNGTSTPIASPSPIATGAATSNYHVAGVAGLVGAFAFALL